LAAKLLFLSATAARRGENREIPRQEVPMRCDFDKLVLYLDKQLDLDAQLDILDHLDRCDTCRDAIYHISVDRDADLFVVPR
jgi:hypothetical protein